MTQLQPEEFKLDKSCPFCNGLGVACDSYFAQCKGCGAIAPRNLWQERKELTAPIELGAGAIERKRIVKLIRKKVKKLVETSQLMMDEDVDAAFGAGDQARALKELADELEAG